MIQSYKLQEKDFRGSLFIDHKSDLKELPRLAQKELYDFVDTIICENPDIKIELLELAFKAAINLEKSRAGISLLHKLTNINTSDVHSIQNVFLYFPVFSQYFSNKLPLS